MTPTSQHRNPARTYRPTDAEYEPARETVEAAGWDMNTAVRGFLRWLNRNPQHALDQLADDLQAVRDETPRGRPRTTDQ